MKKVKIAIIAAVLVALPVTSFFISKAILIDKPLPEQEVVSAEAGEIDKISISRSYPARNIPELIAEADIIVYGTITGIGEPIKIRPFINWDAVTEEEKQTIDMENFMENYYRIFNDYYIEPEIVLQNRSEDENIAQIPIRLRDESGIFNGVEVVVEDDLQLEVGQKYLLFLAHPGMGGSYNTSENQLHILYNHQGVYKEDSFAVLRTYLGEEITLDEVVRQIEEFEASGETVQTQWERFVENQNRNLENGFITQEEYDRFIEEAQMYAEIIE